MATTLLTIGLVGKRLDLSCSQVRRLLAEGKLRAQRVGHVLIFNAGQVERLAEQRLAECAARAVKDR